MLDFLLCAIIACVLLHCISVAVLLRHIRHDSDACNDLFVFTHPLATGGFSFPMLKTKFILPWIPSPDKTRFDAVARASLSLARSCALVVPTALVAMMGIVLAPRNFAPI